VDRQDINLRGKVNDEAEVLKKAFSFAELEAIRERIQAVIDAEHAPRSKGARASGERTMQARSDVRMRRLPPHTHALKLRV
jgi:hypothetical protein